jgi:NAD(P)-dependent dehydrogenase (short-subunit alcohol dehydrogenase family)
MSKPTVLVTGGAARIGASIVKKFAEKGWHCIIHYRDSDIEAAKLQKLLPSAEIIQCDLRNGNEAIDMVRKISSKCNDWRVLVNNASVFPYDNAAQIDPEITDEVMKVNAQTPVRLAQTFLATARSNGGRVVIHITDQKIENTNPDFFSYTMSKHALSSTAKMFTQALEDPRDRVYNVAPGAILPSHDQTPDEIEVSHRLNPLQRKTGVTEIAETALMLAKGYLRSGETIYVDSGQHLLRQRRDVIYLAREMNKGSHRR